MLLFVLCKCLFCNGFKLNCTRQVVNALEDQGISFTNKCINKYSMQLFAQRLITKCLASTLPLIPSPYFQGDGSDTKQMNYNLGPSWQNPT